MSVTIPKNVPKDLFLILQQLVTTLNKRFDIAPGLVQNMLVNKEFLEYSERKFGEFVVNILENLEEKSAIKTLRSIYQKEQPLETINHYLGDELDKCGYLVQRYDNGYHKYCDGSRFDHKDTSHSFTFKTYQQMIEKKIFDLKFEYYKEFLEALSDTIFDYFNKKIQNEYKIYRVKNSLSVLEWLKNSPDSFKSKNGFINDEHEYIDIYVASNGSGPDVGPVPDGICLE